MCYNPIKLQSGIEVGCGHCQQCLKQYQDMWTARLSEEAKSWRKVDGLPPIVFFTLKYRNDTIPCRYLVATELGYYFTTVRPDCTVYPFWTQIKEGVKEWKTRKAGLLGLWQRWYNDTARSLNYERVLNLSDSRDRAIIHEGRFEVRPGVSARAAWCLGLKRSDCVAVLPEDMPVSEGFEDMEVPEIREGVSVPLFAFEFHTVDKDSVQRWFKRSRIRLERALPDVFDQEYNPRFSPDWIDSEGNMHRLPSCAVPKTLKFFVTSEYGPQTFRPHLHGCLFGVTYDEFKKYFAEDWQENYGTVDFSVYDSTRGAFSYISKYCSKGGYDHPYCSKDFFYPSGLEYHSKDYEYCIKDFNLNVPMVSKTFHLVSNGIGVSYAFRNEILSYFGVNLRQFLTDSGRVRYVCQDDSMLALPSMGLIDATFAKCSNSVKIEPFNDGLRIRKYTNTGLLVGESLLPGSAIVDESLENRLLNKQYHRVYVKSNHLPGCGAVGARASRVHPAWHLLGHNVCQLETRETAIALPRYYRQWLLSPLASALRVSAAARLYPSLDEKISRALQFSGPLDESISIVQSVLDSHALERYNSCKNLRQSSERFYFGGSGIEELD